MDSAEVEFIAEQSLITVVPNFSYGKIYLVSGDVGPFVPSIPVTVPLWLALNLRQRQKCHIIPPDWMDVEKLEEKKQEEMEAKYFTLMPSPNYMEITQLLLSCTAKDIPYADRIRTLIKDIWDLRIAKLRSSIDTFVKSDETHAQLNHLTLMEINFIRLFLTQALNQLWQLKQSSVTAEASQSQ